MFTRFIARRRAMSLFACWLAPLASLAPAAARAQVQATTGVIRGTVTDNDGKPIASASLVLLHLETNYSRSATTGTSGAFAAPLMPLGTYRVSIRAIGYRAAVRDSVQLHLGATADVDFRLERIAVAISGVTTTAVADAAGGDRVEAATRFSQSVIARLPNNGRNYLNLVLLTPNTGIVQGPDGAELNISGQRGIHNNISVDGADFNNPFFGEHRGGQRPPFTFNLDAIREISVIDAGAAAEFGRSSGGFVNVVTRSGTNERRGTLHYYGTSSGLSGRPVHDSLMLNPDFGRQQFGFTVGGPLRRDRLFYFLAYDQQVYSERKDQSRPASRALDSLIAWTDTASGGALRGDFGPLRRTNNANAMLVKLDWVAAAAHTLSLKYNFTNSEQANGTFDVPSWGRSANAVERDYSHAVNGSLVSVVAPTVTNELRFQVARENRPRDYAGPGITPGGRRFPDTGMDVVNGFRLGMPFFIPVKENDTRLQALDNVTWVRGDHVVKTGLEWNRTQTNQVFLGLANGRFLFSSVTGFLNYLKSGPSYVECSNGPARLDGQCPGGRITGPVLLYQQQAGVNGLPVSATGTQSIVQHDLAWFAQDSWKPSDRLLVDYGLRWEAQIQPSPLTPPSRVFFAPFIGKTASNATGTYTFPSNGRIPSDWMMLQPRIGAVWNVRGDDRDVIRASLGVYNARVPAIEVASSRTTNGTIGQRLTRTSASTATAGPPPPYPSLLTPPTGVPIRPDVIVFDRRFRNPRTISASAGYEHLLTSAIVASFGAIYDRTDFLERVVNENDAVFGSPWRSGLGPNGSNGLGQLTVIQSTARSRYSGFTLGARGQLSPSLDLQVDYTLSFDRSDDDNERDLFTFRYARADSLRNEFGWSDRDERHRVAGWLNWRAPFGLTIGNVVRASSAQPVSEKCGPNNVGTGKRASIPADRICPDGHILPRNTLRRDNAFFSWDLRLSRELALGASTRLEPVVEVLNITGADNFLDPAATALLFNFDGTVRSGLGDPRQVQLGLRWLF